MNDNLTIRRVWTRLSHQFMRSTSLKRLANGRNIVGCYMVRVRLHIPLHVVTCCCVLLGVVAQSLKPVKLWSKQLLLPTFHLFRDHRSVAQHNGSICTACQTLLGPRTRVQYGLQSIMGCILFTMHYTGKIVGSCCIRLHNTANKGAITVKIVGPTMSGVVASVCT